VPRAVATVGKQWLNVGFREILSRDLGSLNMLAGHNTSAVGLGRMALGYSNVRRKEMVTVVNNPVVSAQQVIGNTKGRFFSVEFIKRTTGEVRKMNCRTGVTLGVTGAGKSFSDSDKGLVTVWDAQISQFRSIPIANIIKITSQGVEWLYGTQV
jgi:hypothetical protein